MNIYEVIQARRTIHKFEPAPISTEFLKEALKAALTAPNHRHTFPWHFVIVGQKARQALLNLALKIEGEKEGEQQLSESAKEKKSQQYLDPSSLVVFCQKVVDDEFQAKEDYASVACSIENFSLVLAAEGWGSKWSTGKITRHAEVYKTLEIDPTQYQIEGFVWVGKAKVEPGKQHRPNIEDVLRILD